jgi:hypothetical protein
MKSKWLLAFPLIAGMTLLSTACDNQPGGAPPEPVEPVPPEQPGTPPGTPGTP